MKKRFAFLASIAAIASGVLSDNAPAAIESPGVKLDPLAQPGTSTAANADGVLTINAGGQRHEFVLRRTEGGELVAGHYSHSSHASHASHRSSSR